MCVFVKLDTIDIYIQRWSLLQLKKTKKKLYSIIQSYCWKLPQTKLIYIIINQLVKFSFSLFSYNVSEKKKNNI